MAYGEPRADVQAALKEARALGVKVKVEGEVFERPFEDEGYIEYVTEDRVLIVRDKNKKRVGGLPFMLVDIRQVWLDTESGQSPGSAAAPVDNPPRPKGGGPGKAEPIPEPERATKDKVDA